MSCFECSSMGNCKCFEQSNEPECATCNDTKLIRVRKPQYESEDREYSTFICPNCVEKELEKSNTGYFVNEIAGEILRLFDNHNVKKDKS